MLVTLLKRSRLVLQYSMFRFMCTSVLLTALLAGCAAPSKMTKAPVLTGALVVVRLENRLEFPPAVTIEVVSEVDGSLTAVAGRRHIVFV